VGVVLPVTATAADAPLRIKHDLAIRPLAFRVMTPVTAQRAALQENGGADSRPVVYRVFHDVKNNSPGHK